MLTRDDVPADRCWSLWYREAHLRGARAELEWWTTVLNEMHRIQARQQR